MHHVDYVARVDEALSELAGCTHRHVLLKEHPLYAERRRHRPKVAARLDAVIKRHCSRARSRVSRFPDASRALADILREDDVHCVVAFNSNSLTDAVVAGVRAVALDRGAYAWPVCEKSLHGIEAPAARPDRTQWLWDLAYTQWRPCEVGVALRRLGL